MNWQDAVRESKYRIAYRGTTDGEIFIRYSNGDCWVIRDMSLQEASWGSFEGFTDWRPF